MSAIVVIPARYHSTRFPGKPLAPLKGIPVIEHVYRNAAKSSLADEVLVATDDQRIFETVSGFGGKAVMTSPAHLSGTDRIAEVADRTNYDIIVNVQGDEPLIKAEMIDDVISLLDDAKASLGTLAKKINDPEDIFNPNIVKVVTGADGFAIYFSRAPIPYHRDEWKNESSALRWNAGGAEQGSFDCFKHIGIYSYRRDVLLKLSSLPASRLELIEKLEQLRAIENNFRIKVKETYAETFGVDTPEDLERIKTCLSLSS